MKIDISAKAIVVSRTLGPTGQFEHVVVFEPTEKTKRDIQKWWEKKDNRFVRLIDGPKTNRQSFTGDGGSREVIAKSTCERLKIVSLTLRPLF